MIFLIDQDQALYTTIVRNSWKAFHLSKGKLANSKHPGAKHEVPIKTDIIFSIVDKEGVKTRAKRCEHIFEKFVSHSELRHPKLKLLPGDIL